MENERSIEELIAGEVALVAAGANNAANPDLGTAICIDAAPSNLTAPSGVVVAAALWTPRRSGVCQLAMSLIYTLSAAGSASFVPSIVSVPTSFAGGIVAGTNWRVENGGTPITFTGGTPTALAARAETLAAADLVRQFTYTLTFATAPNSKAGFQLAVTSAQNLASLVMNASIVELA